MQQLSWERQISEVTQRAYTDLFLAAPEGTSYFLFPTVYFFFSGCVSVELREAVEIRKLNDQRFV